MFPISNWNNQCVLYCYLIKTKVALTEIIIRFAKNILRREKSFIVLININTDKL